MPRMAQSMMLDMEANANEKMRENRIRRMAARQGCTLVKFRTRDPRSILFGRYRVIDTRGCEAAYSLDDIESLLLSDSTYGYPWNPFSTRPSTDDPT